MKLGRIIMLTALAGLAACTQAKEPHTYFPLPEHTQNVVHSRDQSFTVDTVVTGLSRPWSMAFLPDDRMLITEREGNLWMIKEGKLLPEPVQGPVPSGLRDIALHPQYDQNGWIYLSYYQEPGDGEGGYTVLIRSRLQGHRLTDVETLYTAGPFEEGGNWYGSRIAFDTKGYLFFTVGIRGARANAQDLSNHAGKTMRLYDDGRIPEDNPFVDSPGALPEIYTYGHRMHEGLVRHPRTGELWSHEHGAKGGDEINIIGPGRNYGWPEVTYSLNYDGSIISEDTLREGMEPPIHHWTPSIAPSGMDFAINSRYPAWEGNLFSGALSHRLLMRSIIEGHRVIEEEPLLEDIGRVRSVKQAPDGLLYVMSEDNGLIVRLVPAP
ncbi:PQQ-dependent sugar dehydrogenase [Fodinibius sediminis]|uniref:Glucose/arabinose dehydrogenase, beta-propeller fold n=1 Tax=Fodinibius sediminis TaxID=1214077 RepID=A0A521CG43_9BACT|nr:PQQ-dependent sugar dehydrogenase [Fodinibius sediminis]SMO58396.1 Glucose/arabinose dehydrogenase, beta-propeller fold [Fodinibius sediminis]